MIDKITADKVPLITINHGRTDSTDRPRVPLVFPLVLNPWSEASGIINYIGMREGGCRQAEGQEDRGALSRFALRQGNHSDLALLSQKYGFEVTADRGAASRQRTAVAMADRSAASSQTG